MEFLKIIRVASTDVVMSSFAKAIDFLICAGWCLPEVTFESLAVADLGSMESVVRHFEQNKMSVISLIKWMT